MWTFEREQEVVKVRAGLKTIDFDNGVRSVKVASAEDIGRIFRIRDIAMGSELLERLGLPMRVTRDALMLQLYEHPVHCWYEASLFRPVRKTDISLLQRLLAPAPKQKELVS